MVVLLWIAGISLIIPYRHAKYNSGIKQFGESFVSIHGRLYSVRNSSVEGVTWKYDLWLLKMDGQL